MEENVQFKHIKKNTIVSTMSLFFQSGYSAVLGLVANLVLTILLSPDAFGIYITVLSLISLLNYFSDIGLAASLIQKKELHDDDIKTTFTTQQILIITAITVGFIVTPFIRQFYALPVEGIYLYWALLISFFISSLKTIPSIFLERKIQFQKIVLVQIIENTFFYISVIIFALLGFNLRSFTIAVLLRAIVGLIVIYRISPWMPRIGISRKSLKHLLTFGLPFQASSFLALFKDDLITLFLAKILGFQGVGYIGWAKKWAEAPIRIIMDSISRVLFPVISRLQHDKLQITKILNKILYYQTLLLAPTLIGSAFLMTIFVDIVPKYHKWTPALPIFYMFCFSAFLSTYSTPFINMFNALGKARTPFTFMLLWTITTWICTPLFTQMFGIYGFPITQIILSLTFVLVVYQAKKLLTFEFIPSIYKGLSSALVMGVFVYLVQVMLGHTYLSFLTSLVVGVSSYIVTIQILFKVNVVEDIKSIFIHE